ncbi:UNVERIFIED_CONTAM: hypothetical protein NCL1_52495 [Trichonephila clavipes]
MHTYHLVEKLVLMHHHNLLARLWGSKKMIANSMLTTHVKLEFPTWRVILNSGDCCNNMNAWQTGLLVFPDFSENDTDDPHILVGPPSTQRILQRRNKFLVSQKLKDVPRDISTEM